MKKQIVTSVLTGAALVALAGAASAATEINVYGASAQYKFWKAAAPAFMADTIANGGLGCTVTSVEYDNSAVDSLDVDNKNTFIVKGTGCDTNKVDADGVMIFRESSKSSYDGIFAVIGSTNSMASYTECATDTTIPAGQSVYYRLMASDSADKTKKACFKITHGATDVPASAFVQTSSGKLYGPNPAYTSTVSRAFSGEATFPGVSSLTKYAPVKIPFGFYISNTVTAKVCTTVSDGALLGEYCNVNADCGATSGVCGAASSANVTNMTREMATQLFSGGISNWNQFAGFDTQAVTLCFRHAGSGTHASLDTAVMNKTWGKAMPTAEVSATTFLKPVKIWFNDSSTDLKWCLTNVAGSVGYLDGDSTAPSGATRLKYNGHFPSANAVAQGEYDFYSDQTIYQAPGLAPTAASLGSYLFGSGGYLNPLTGGNAKMAPANRVYIATDNMMKVKRKKLPNGDYNMFTYPGR